MGLRSRELEGQKTGLRPEHVHVFVELWGGLCAPKHRFVEAFLWQLESPRAWPRDWELSNKLAIRCPWSKKEGALCPLHSGRGTKRTWHLFVAILLPICRSNAHQCNKRVFNNQFIQFGYYCEIKIFCIFIISKLIQPIENCFNLASEHCTSLLFIWLYACLCLSVCPSS